ncbi:hypothetical protein, partial [Roseobacter sp. HKCCA0434]|uniref:hypothetical protein n=1 Tax=Roseobacter sp. HKCCA0434 TaxID=3079297 RepID=UPI002905AA0D
MTALYLKIFAERNCGADRLTRLARKGWDLEVLRGHLDLPRDALREMLQTVPPRERTALHNRLLDAEHYRLLYSDFGWSAAAPPRDIVQSAGHARDTVFLGCHSHPVAFALRLAQRPRTPGAPRGAALA